MNPDFLERNLRIVFIVLAAAAIFIFIVFKLLFAAPGGTPEHFVILRGTDQNEIIQQLYEQKFIKSRTGFKIALRITSPTAHISAGGYTLDRNTNAFGIARALQHPEEKWIVVLEGVRREEIVTLLSNAFRWNDQEKNDFLSYRSPKMFGLTEGVYFPDTYLIPIHDSGTKVAERMVNRLQEKITPYGKEFAAANVKTDTAIKLASLVQREAADKQEMPLIAGILWNRLDQHMKLDIDATLQYARGDTGSGWWAPITTQDKNINSPYNTYLHEGLPPGPIANPGIDAILAVLKPQSTKCLFYLHDKTHTIHCAATYAEHLKNIQMYLK